MMGPAPGTDAYKDQVTIISTALQSLPVEMLDLGLSLYIFDTSYSRSAICEAEKILRKKAK